MVWLVQKEAANPARKDGFDIAVVGFWNLEKPRQSRIVVTPRVIRFAKRKVGVGPVGFETRSLVKFAKPEIIFVRKKAASVMFKRINAQWTLALREFREVQPVLSLV